AAPADTVGSPNATAWMCVENPSAGVRSHAAKPTARRAPTSALLPEAISTTPPPPWVPAEAATPAENEPCDRLKLPATAAAMLSMSAVRWLTVNPPNEVIASDTPGIHGGPPEPILFSSSSFSTYWRIQSVGEVTPALPLMRR